MRTPQYPPAVPGTRCTYGREKREPVYSKRRLLGHLITHCDRPARYDVEGCPACTYHANRA